MKQFFSKFTILFLLLSGIIIFLLFFTNHHINANTSFKIGDEVNKIVLGHSHPETAYNDSLINNFRNLSTSGESYFYTYSKLKKIVEANPQVDTVFIEYTNNQINKGMDEWIWGQRYLEHKYKRRAPFISEKETLLLVRKNPTYFIPLFFNSLKNNLKRVLTGDYQYRDTHKFGGYNYLKRNKTDSLVKNRRSVKRVDKDSVAISEKNIEYLKKCISFIERNNISVFLIRTPQHSLEVSLQNEEKFQEIKNENFKNVPFLEFGSVGFKNKDFADFGHLNYTGARKFSIWFNGLVNRGMLRYKNPQHIIDREQVIFKTKDEESHKKLYENYLKSRQNLLIDDVTENGKEYSINAEIRKISKFEKVFLYQENYNKYIAIRCEKCKIEDYSNIEISVYGIVKKTDYKKRPKWLSNKNSNLLTWKAGAEIIKSAGASYIFVPLKKHINTTSFERLRIYAHEKGEFKNRLIPPIVIESPSFIKEN